MYKASYLPIALDDLRNIIRYITHELKAPRAAENLRLKIDKEVKKIEENPLLAVNAWVAKSELR
ncbi:MAG: hypothetical protein FWD14_00795 [Treponema sp.]|nr:hypothetical protein [Treponema sp.]